MLVLHNKYGHLDSAADLIPVAVTTMKFKIQEFRRDRDRAHSSIESTPFAPPRSTDPNPEQSAHTLELRALLLSAIQELGERCRELFRLKLEGYNYQEIKERMGAGSVNTVYVWDHRCTEQLRPKLKGAK